MATRQDLVARAMVFATAVHALGRHVRNDDAGSAYMGRQLFRASAAIGALLEEGQVAASPRDMASKYLIALREAREARYWLRLLGATQQSKHDVQPLIAEASEFVAMLTTSVRKLRERDRCLLGKRAQETGQR